MLINDPAAAYCSFERFYHYQTFNKDHLTVTLRDQKLYFSDPHTFNDPWDCKPWFDYRPLLADPVKREEFITLLRSSATPEMVADPLSLVYEDLVRKDDDHLRKAVDGLSRNLTRELRKRRVYCLTPFPDSTLMWSHYAANHRGICLEFNKTNPLIGKARPVKYRKEYPEWPPQIGDSLMDIVLTKSVDWFYEREFRLIGTALDGPTKLDGNFVFLPGGALESIIVGCESENYDEIITVVKENAPSLPVKRAARVPNHYKLTIEI